MRKDTKKNSQASNRGTVVEGRWQELRPLRWFLLCWISIVYLWGWFAERTLGIFLGGRLNVMVIVGITNNQPAPVTGRAGSFSYQQMPAGTLNTITAAPSSLFTGPPDNSIFAVLMALHFVLHLLGLFRKWPRRWLWPYFFVQGICLVGISITGKDMSIVIGLYLALTMEAVVLLERLRPIASVVGSYLILLIGTLLWQGSSLFLWTTTDYVSLVLFIIAGIILYFQQIHARTQLELAHLRLASYAAQVEQLTLADERQRMARELHDTLAQGLAGVVMQLEAINSHLKKQRAERAQEIIVQAMSRARGILAETRQAIDNLRREQQTASTLLADELQQEILHFTSATGIPCSLEIDPLPQLAEPPQEHIKRTVAEGLTNIARHAQASQVWVKIRRDEAALMVEVRDNGIGFAPEQIQEQIGHYGLLGIKERARLIGGHAIVSSKPGEGTTLKLSIPETGAAEDAEEEAVR